ncbi:MAG: phosphonate metabolism protein/1,5-bisphosphokinase (PRPP-forming) PhnN [Gammaproteobacteria bacterium]
MSHRLVYVIGPSGAGKDSVLQGLRQTWPEAASAHWARRTITRDAQAGGEQHEAVDADTFVQLARAQAFAMHWTANGLSYGVRHAELQALRQGGWVFVNGSRGWLSRLLVQWPQATVVHIGASPDVLARRLAARGRENADAVAQRLARQVTLDLPPDSIRIENNGALADAVCALQQALQALRAPSEA